VKQQLCFGNLKTERWKQTLSTSLQSFFRKDQYFCNIAVKQQLCLGNLKTEIWKQCLSLKLRTMRMRGRCFNARDPCSISHLEFNAATTPEENNTFIGSQNALPQIALLNEISPYYNSIRCDSNIPPWGCKAITLKWKKMGRTRTEVWIGWDTVSKPWMFWSDWEYGNNKSSK